MDNVYRTLPKGNVESEAFEAPARCVDGTLMTMPTTFTDGQISIYEFGLAVYDALLKHGLDEHADANPTHWLQSIALEAAVAEKLIEEIPDTCDSCGQEVA